jgi:hypothetical protein
LKFAPPVNPLILCYGVQPAIQADRKANCQPMTNNKMTSDSLKSDRYP